MGQTRTYCWFKGRRQWRGRSRRSRTSRRHWTVRGPTAGMGWDWGHGRGLAWAPGDEEGRPRRENNITVWGRGVEEVQGAHNLGAHATQQEIWPYQKNPRLMIRYRIRKRWLQRADPGLSSVPHCRIPKEVRESDKIIADSPNVVSLPQVHAPMWWS